ncbi:hypothetical protein RHSIM_Rhsim05G0118400 [Rhododendron simsii]|uniref:Uncharacterized protein n=1 Tax=Rhododendron simsii TaxID=118357 RepID=A0A834H214_RHOSS|nr:hypothetical protein RHSIM_Rhsim05G0118400 [Rhododendron simsii]
MHRYLDHHDCSVDYKAGSIGDKARSVDYKAGSRGYKWYGSGKEGADGTTRRRDQTAGRDSEAAWGTTWQKRERRDSDVPPLPIVQFLLLQVFSMVDSFSSGSPRVDADAYPTLQETIENLEKGYLMGGNMDFNESSSNFARVAREPSIPRIHIPLQINDRSSRDNLYGWGNSSDEDTEPIYHASGQKAK